MPLREPRFAEREGARPLPAQLDLKNISTEARARLWNVFYTSLSNSRRSTPRSHLYRWETILRDAWVFLDHRFADQFPALIAKQIEYAKEKMTLPYSDLLDFVELAAFHSQAPSGLPERLNAELEATGCAYRLRDGMVVPISSEQMATAFSGALATLGGEFASSRAHLQAAAKALTKGDYAGSIRESIHAVESVARRISGAKTLGPALDKISSSGLHPALKKGFSSLYGFTSDEQGIRHALLESDMANVGEQEALYMLGSCAAFAGYLKNRFVSAQPYLLESE